MRKAIWITSLIIIAVVCGYVYFQYYFVFGTGVKTGTLNYAVRKGNLFKTYEGKLIQQGFRSRGAGNIQSYEFEFSVANKKVFDILEVNSGKVFDLHYNEYHNTLPWRGNTVYVVDSIIAMRAE